jgi:hypothetical protein
MFKELLLKKLIDKSFDVAKKMLFDAGSEPVSEPDYQKALQYHIDFVENWSSEVSFVALKTPKSTTNIFVDLDVFVYPRRTRMDVHECIQKFPIYDLFAHADRHVVLLGQPGAGKTTSMKRLCQSLIHDEHFYPDRFAFPLVIRLRNLNQRASSVSPLLDEIISALGLLLHLHKDVVEHNEYDFKEKLVVETLQELQPLLILDGFDEIASPADRERTLKTIRALANHLSKATMVITGRTGDFPYNIDGAVQYEISPLTSEQILEFVTRWLQNPGSAEKLLIKLESSPFADTAVRPLTLAHLCAIYEKLGSLPEKPKTIYRRIVTLLLQEWDEQRSVKRQSKYAHFDVPAKLEFLWHLAYILTTWTKSSIFSNDDLLEAYELIHENCGLPRNEARLVVSELESHTGLFLESGFEQFEFAHKSLQEYLTAEYIVRLPLIPAEKDLIEILPNEFALAISISSNPSAYFYQLVTKTLQGVALPESWLKAFLNRLLLERPIFSGHFEAGLALLTLYTKHLLDPTYGIGFSPSDQLLKDFEAVVEACLNPASFKALTEYFHITKIVPIESGSDLRTFSLTESGRLLKKSLDLPTVLYAPSTFFKSESEQY